MYLGKVRDFLELLVCRTKNCSCMWQCMQNLWVPTNEVKPSWGEKTVNTKVPIRAKNPEDPVAAFSSTDSQTPRQLNRDDIFHFCPLSCLQTQGSKEMKKLSSWWGWLEGTPVYNPTDPFKSALFNLAVLHSSQRRFNNMTIFLFPDNADLTFPFFSQ